MGRMIMSEHEIKIGDKVKVIDKKHYSFNRVGIVVGTNPYRISIGNILNGCYDINVFEEQIEKI